MTDNFLNTLTMVYNLIEADEVIARLDNDFNVNTGSYVSRIPQWIYQCLMDLNIYIGLIPKAYVADVEDFHCDIPSDLHKLTGIEYNGYRLDRRATTQFKYTSITDVTTALVTTNVGVTLHGSNVEVDDTLDKVSIDVSRIRVFDTSSINELPISNQYYYLIPNGKIETSFESGVVIFHYYIFPSSYNERLNSLCPLIPDTEAVKESVTWYLFQQILQRGFKHPVFTLGNPNQVLDPYSRYRISRRNAKNKATLEDPDQARIIDRMWQSQLYNNIAGER